MKKPRIPLLGVEPETSKLNPNHLEWHTSHGVFRLATDKASEESMWTVRRAHWRPWPGAEWMLLFEATEITKLSAVARIDAFIKELVLNYNPVKEKNSACKP